MSAELTCKDFAVNEVVRHIFHGRCFIVDKVGRKYIHGHLTTDTGTPVHRFTFLPTSLMKVS